MVMKYGNGIIFGLFQCTICDSGEYNIDDSSVRECLSCDPCDSCDADANSGLWFVGSCSSC